MDIKKWLGIAAGAGTIISLLVALFSNREMTDEELREKRDRLQDDYNNPDLEDSYRNDCKRQMDNIDRELGKRAWEGKEYGYPAHSEHGWHLPSDD